MAFPNYPKAINEGLPNGFASSRGGEKIKWVVVHVAAGFWDGTIAWFNDPRAQANSHYLVGLDGRVCQFVDEKWAAWHSYPANEESVGIEHVDNLKNGSPNWMSQAEFEASAQLTAYLLKKYGLTTAAIKRHNEVGQTSHNCPGPFFPMDRYKARVSEILKGGSVTPTRPPAGPQQPSSSLWRVVVGQGESVLRLARQRGYDKAWMLGTRVIVGAGGRKFAESVQRDAINKGFKDAWLLEVYERNPEMPSKPAPFKWPAYNPGGAPQPRAASYVLRHPTRYNWTPGVEKIARSIVTKFPGTSVNTYVGHPPGWEQYERVSLDVWHENGRGVSLPSGLGDQVFKYVFNLPGAPHIEWIIYKGRMWTRSGGWQNAPGGAADSDPGHWKHIHISYALGS